MSFPGLVILCRRFLRGLSFFVAFLDVIKLCQNGFYFFTAHAVLDVIHFQHLANLVCFRKVFSDRLAVCLQQFREAVGSHFHEIAMLQHEQHDVFALVTAADDAVRADLGRHLAFQKMFRVIEHGDLGTFQGKDAALSIMRECVQVLYIRK